MVNTYSTWCWKQWWT